MVLTCRDMGVAKQSLRNADAPREMNMLVIVQNDPTVPPGLLLDLVHGEGVPLRFVRLFSEDHSLDFEDAGGVIVLGGTMSVGDTTEFPFLLPLKAFIRELVHKGIPYLGICLGGQLLAEVLGGKVHLRKHGEKGCSEIALTESGANDPLFTGISREFISFQWHSDSFEPPPGALHLARSDACRYQAFRWGRAAYGLQFHPEVTQMIIQEWSEDLHDDRRELLHTFTEKEVVYRSISFTILNNFLKMVSPL
jgi:GMP synthase (glutamine-hydrolysing)